MKSNFKVVIVAVQPKMELLDYLKNNRKNLIPLIAQYFNELSLLNVQKNSRCHLGFMLFSGCCLHPLDGLILLPPKATRIFINTMLKTLQSFSELIHLVAQASEEMIKEVFEYFHGFTFLVWKLNGGLFGSRLTFPIFDQFLEFFKLNLSLFGQLHQFL